jgi:hypothetical protein
MKLPQYVSPDEVQRVCNMLQIRDWTQLQDADIELGEAERIQQVIGAEASEISSAEFKKGLEVELEHGLAFPDANITNNHPILTGLIVLAHLKEMLDYYDRLEVAELEGDTLKALEQGDAEKVAHKYGQLVEAKAHLAATELARLHQAGSGD